MVQVRQVDPGRRDRAATRSGGWPGPPTTCGPTTPTGPGSPSPPPSARRARTSRPSCWRRTTTGHPGDPAVVVGMVELQLFGAANPHLAAADLHVHPDHRRLGVGAALLAELERRVTEAERTALLMEVFVTPGEPSPGREFALRHGFAVAMEEGFKACDLRATEDRWDALEAEAAAPPRGLPDRHVAAPGARGADGGLLPAAERLPRRGAPGRDGDPGRAVGREAGPGARRPAGRRRAPPDRRSGPGGGRVTGGPVRAVGGRGRPGGRHAGHHAGAARAPRAPARDGAQDRHPAGAAQPPSRAAPTSSPTTPT